MKKRRMPNAGNSREISFELMGGYRYNSILIFSKEENQFYCKNSTSKMGVGYTCYVPECQARVHLRDGKCFISNAVTHNHEDKKEMYTDLIVMNKCKRILRSVENRKDPKEVFDSVIAE